MFKTSILLVSALLTSNLLFGQRIVTPSEGGMPSMTKKNGAVPFIGLTFSFQLLKLSSQKLKPTQTFKRTSSAEPFMPIYNLQEGPIAWEYTGEEVQVKIPNSSTSGSYGFGGNGWGWYGGNGNTGGDITYEVDGPSGGGGYSDGGAPTYVPPKIITTAKKVAINHCNNGKSIYKAMYDQQAARTREQAALITDKGIYWLSDAENTAIKSEVGNGQFPKGTDNKPYFIDGNTTVNILAIVHTHPPGEAYYGLSVNDMQVAKDFNVPVYAIADEGIWKGTPNGNASIVNYDMNSAFDCSTAVSLFL